ncbi:MAG TPA: cytochrome b/b6 domain-containing protein, partial [Asticcacaulis sp.]|nr:cytochrome b/b6 domain-containing protein [Asticcacaulis sp.]
MNLYFHLMLRILHWLMAALVLFMLFIGVGMVSTTGHAYVTLLALHRPIGMAIFGLALIRMVVRLFTGAPDLPADLPKWQVCIAKGVHVVLYGLMIAMPLIGWAMLSAGGYPIRMMPIMNLPP